MARLGFKLKGFEKVRKNLQDITAAYEKALLAAIRTEAELIMTESQKQVPVSASGSGGRPPGFLRDSKFIRKKRGGLEVELGYSAFYATFVHEADPATNFRVGKRKYLEDPIKEASKGYAKRVAERTRRIVERGARGDR